MSKSKNVNIKPTSQKKRGRKPKNDKKENSEILTQKEILELNEQWKNGKINKFKSGNVVKNRETNQIGVIQNIVSSNYKYYSIKWHIGVPYKWSYKYDTVHEDDIKRSREKNPIDIPSWEKYPGPSSNQILKIKQSCIEQKENIDIEAIIESYEDTRKNYNSSKLEDLEDDVDSVVDKTLDDDEEMDGDKMYEILKRDLENN